VLYEPHLLTLWEPPAGQLRLLWLVIGLRREPASHVYDLPKGRRGSPRPRIMT